MLKFFFSKKRKFVEFLPSATDTPGHTSPKADTCPPGQTPLWADTSLGRHLPGQIHPRQTPWADPPQAVTSHGQTSPLGRHPWVRNPPRQTPHWTDTPLADTPLPTATAADGTHSTGMHSCKIIDC